MSRSNVLTHRAPCDVVLDDLARGFQPFSPDPITRDDAREMSENLHGFFGVLERWARDDAANRMGPWAHLVLDEHPFVDGR
jgi:hypothetical protein